MDENAVHDERITNLIRKIARHLDAIIIGFGVIVFVAEFFEAFSSELDPYPWYENLIPVTLFTAVVGLALAWRWEGPGGAITIVSLAVNLGIYLVTGRDAVGMVVLILTPILIPGVLFLVCWYRLNKKRN